MKRIFIALILMLAFVVPSHAAYLCDATDDYIEITDNANLNIPDGDFTFACRVKLTNNSMSADSRIYQWSDIGGREFTLNLLNAGGSSDEISFAIGDGVDSTSATSTASPFSGNTSWTDVAFVRSSTTFTLYVNAVSVATSAVGNVDGIDADNNPRFCNRFDAARPLDGSEADCAFWTRAPTTTELAARVTHGYAANCFRNALVWYTPFVNSVQDVGKGMTVTPSGAVPTTHLRLYNCGE